MGQGITRVGKDGFNNTHLSLDLAEKRGIIHRDYIAHCLRWSHATKVVNAKFEHGKTARIADIGCGKELPFAKALYTNRLTPEAYVGIDINKLAMPEMFHEGVKFQPRLMGETDFVKVTEEALGFKPNVITCFEVLEHVPPAHAREMLKRMYDLLEEGGIAFISTPCWDPEVGAADNHLNEMRYSVLGALIEDLGFTIEGHWGTFASLKDYKDELIAKYGEPGAAILAGLRGYYDSNMAAVLFAPLFPHLSRNCIWQIKKVAQQSIRQFDPLDSGKHAEPWTSNETWNELNA